jgi:hypothetical protein
VNKKRTARKYGISLCEIRRWLKSMIKIKAIKKPNAKTCGKGPKIQYPDLEDELCECFEQM